MIDRHCSRRTHLPTWATNTKGKWGYCIRRYSRSHGRSGIDRQDRQPQPLTNCVHELVLCTEPLLEFQVAVTVHIVRKEISSRAGTLNIDHLKTNSKNEHEGEKVLPTLLARRMWLRGD